MVNNLNNLPVVKIKKGHDKRINNGYLWLFSNEIEHPVSEVRNGDIVEIISPNGGFLGRGFYNRNSLISVRFLTNSKTELIISLLQRRIKNADEFRARIYPGRTAYRMVFSESDLLPGLIIDRYNSTFVLQVNTAGMELLLPAIVNILITDHQASSIFTMSDKSIRQFEGLDYTNTQLFGEQHSEIIEVEDIKYSIDFTNSQKTGFFFDQSVNRSYFSRFSENCSVFDGFCNSGGFGMHAMKNGARQVVFADSSNQQIETVKINIELNGLNDSLTEYVVDDVFDLLEKFITDQRIFDVVIVDPPAFTKSKSKVQTALKGYEKLHHLAMQVLKPDGILMSTSCSHHISEIDYQQSIQKAATRTNSALQLIHRAGAAPDHPRLASMDETAYLKFLVFRKIGLS